MLTRDSKHYSQHLEDTQAAFWDASWLREARRNTVIACRWTLVKFRFENTVHKTFNIHMSRIHIHMCACVHMHTTECSSSYSCISWFASFHETGLCPLALPYYVQLSLFIDRVYKQTESSHEICSPEHYRRYMHVTFLAILVQFFLKYHLLQSILISVSSGLNW